MFFMYYNKLTYRLEKDRDEYAVDDYPQRKFLCFTISDDMIDEVSRNCTEPICSVMTYNIKYIMKKLDKELPMMDIAYKEEINNFIAII